MMKQPTKRTIQRPKTLKKRWFRGFLPLELLDWLKRQQVYSIGTIMTILLIISPIAIWLSNDPSSVRNPLIAFAKLNAFMAISTLSINFILATRLQIFENLFHGLDRMYRVHKIVGRISLLFMILHPLFLIANTYPNSTTIVRYLLPLGSFDVSIGIIALYLFLVLIALTVAINIPYHYWHNSHKILGIVLVFAAYHAVLAGSDLGRFPFLRLWVIVLTGLGIISWIYMLVFYKKFGPKYQVILDTVDHLSNVTDLYFKRPKGFSFQPGQFIFIRFPRFEGYKELFPFSLSNDSSQNLLRVSIKRSGDYTSEKVPLLKKGDEAVIMGPYGRFGERYLKHDWDMIWIAGGIGITPFLSLAKHETLYPTDRKILLIWVIRNKTEAFHDRELNDESKKNTNFSYVHWFSDTQGRINTDEIIKILGEEQELKKRLIFLCGPPGMMYSLCHGFRKQGISYRQIIFEDFNMLD